MSHDASTPERPAWRQALPVLSGSTVTLREPTPADSPALLQVLSTADIPQFGLDGHLSEAAVAHFIERARDDRSRGFAFTYVVTIGSGRLLVGLLQMRALDPLFESAEWDGLIVPAARGTAVFFEAARLVGSFAFDTVGAYRLECRVLLQNGRANGALLKLGASQEGLLRRSIRRDSQYHDQVLWAVLKEDWAGQSVPSGPRVH